MNDQEIRVKASPLRAALAQREAELATTRAELAAQKAREVGYVQAMDAMGEELAAAHATIHQLGENAAKAAERVAVLERALGNVRAWAASLTVCDMNEIIADGGITAGMFVGQEAGEQVRRIDRILARAALTEPTDEA